MTCSQVVAGRSVLRAHYSKSGRERESMNRILAGFFPFTRGLQDVALVQDTEERPLLENAESQSPSKAMYTPTFGRLHSGAARQLSRDFPTRTLSGPSALQHQPSGKTLHSLSTLISHAPYNQLCRLCARLLAFCSHQASKHGVASSACP